MNKVGKSDVKMNRRETARRTRTEQKTLWLFRRGLRVERVGIRSRAALVAGTMVKGGREEQKQTETNCKNQKLQIKTTKAQTNSGEQRFVTK